jgi:hypothetical protein
VDAAMRTLRATQGESVEIVFESDEAAELHLHGYDIAIEVQPGVPAAMRVAAKIAGRFSIEAHRFGRAGADGGRKSRHVVLLYLEVHPR